MLNALFRRRGLLGLCLAAALAAAGTPGCKQDTTTPFTRLAEARDTAADLRLEFTRAADASNRAVMADTDEASVAFAAEARLAKEAVKKDAAALGPLLRGLDYDDETRVLEEFGKRYGEYDALDRSVLELAVENTNLKAQQLSFGPARDAARAFRTALESVTRAASSSTSCKVAPLALGAVIAVEDIQVLHAPHIAESDEAAMARMEKEMDALSASARGALATLSGLVAPASQPDLAAATGALDRFDAVHAQLIALSRKNTNVRSLTLSLGQKRTLSSACEAILTSLSDALAKRGFSATR